MAARDDSIMFVFLSTLSLRRATASQGADTGDKVFLSTLSLRRATHQTYQLNAKREFLSTLSLRRATLAGPSGPAFLFNFYPRSPCGERPVRVVRTCWSPYFYPRSPCGERHGQDVLLPAALEFLSTLSLRRATIGGSTNQTHKINFYPRSPCGERLFGNEAMGAGNNNFYPRSPCGERPRCHCLPGQCG